MVDQQGRHTETAMSMAKRISGHILQEQTRVREPEYSYRHGGASCRLPRPGDYRQTNLTQLNAHTHVLDALHYTKFRCCNGDRSMSKEISRRCTHLLRHFVTAARIDAEDTAPHRLKQRFGGYGHRPSGPRHRTRILPARLRPILGT